MSTERFEQTRYQAMVERALSHAQEPALAPVAPMVRTPVRMRFAAPAFALAAALILFYFALPAPAPQPSFSAEMHDISDTAIYEALNDWTNEA